MKWTKEGDDHRKQTTRASRNEYQGTHTNKKVIVIQVGDAVLPSSSVVVKVSVVETGKDM